MPADSRKITVRLPEAAYDVLIGPGSLAQVGSALRPLTKAAKAAIVTDACVAGHYLPACRKSLEESGFDVVHAVIPAGEDHKTLSELLPVYDRLLGHALDRSVPVIGLGGGVITDMAGFVAATLLRGLPLVQVPTSLLAMVDASVGGKTGVNHAVGKNLIGAFHQPISVIIDPQVLRTLPPRELSGGLAECIKHDLIRDAKGFDSLEQNINLALALDIDYLADLVAHNVAIKARVVEKDPFERGERAHLNFGHTFGHAIETVSHFEYTHGESVALGMVAAAHTSRKLGMIDDVAFGRIVAVIRQAGLPVDGLRLDVEAVVAAMAFDKKAAAGKLRFVLLERIGQAVVRDDVPVELVREALRFL